MVNAPEKNFSPLPAGMYGRSTKRSTQWCHRASEDKGGLQAEWVRALGALHSLGSKKMLVAEKRRDTYILCSEKKEKCIEDYVERETAGERKWVEDAEAAIRQVEEDTEVAENAGVTAREPEITFHKIMVAIGDSLSDIASSEDGQDGEDEDDEETEQGQLSDNDKPGWVMGTTTKTVQQRIERFLPKQIKLD